jgi:hypothetical protein
VLHTTRTGAAVGRYESPELGFADVDAFLRAFGRFVAEDGRHDLWIVSHDEPATIVLDRHNIIYAYGPLELFERKLLELGAVRGERRTPTVFTLITTTRSGTRPNGAVVGYGEWKIHPLKHRIFSSKGRGLKPELEAEAELIGRSPKEPAAIWILEVPARGELHEPRLDDRGGVPPGHAVVLHFLQDRVRVERVVEIDVQIDGPLARR